MAISQEQREVQTQKVRVIYGKIEVLDSDLNVITEINGEYIDGDYNIVGKVGMRRNCNVTLKTSRTTLPSPVSYIWLNKRFRLYVGIKNLKTDNIVWFIVGTFAINDPVRDVTISGSDTLKIKGVDFTAFINDTIGSRLGYPEKITKGMNIGEAIKGIITVHTGFNFNVSESEYTVPYTLKKDKNTNVWGVLEELIGLYMNYEGFFDPYGVFVFQKMSNLYNDPIVWDFREQNCDLIKRYSIDYQWNKLRNRITVQGREKDEYAPSYTYVASSIAYKDKNDTIGTMFGVDSLKEATAFKYKLDDSTKKLFDVNSEQYKKYMDKEAPGDLKDLRSRSKDDYDFIEKVIQYYFVGAIDRKNIRIIVYKGMGFKDLYGYLLDRKLQDLYSSNPRDLFVQEQHYWNVDQCRIRALYEADTRLVMAQKVTIECVPIYSLDVNQLIYLDIPDDSFISGKYCVDSISCKLKYDGLMTIECHKVDKPRFALNQEAMHKIETDIKDENSNGQSVGFNTPLSYELVHKYNIDEKDNKEIVVALAFQGDNSWGSKYLEQTVKVDYDVKEKVLAIKGEPLYRDENKNWYTDTKLIGQSFFKDAGWKGDKPADGVNRSSFWVGVVGQLDVRDVDRRRKILMPIVKDVCRIAWETAYGGYNKDEIDDYIRNWINPSTCYCWAIYDRVLCDFKTPIFRITSKGLFMRHPSGFNKRVPVVEFGELTRGSDKIWRVDSSSITIGEDINDVTNTQRILRERSKISYLEIANEARKDEIKGLIEEDKRREREEEEKRRNGG